MTETASPNHTFEITEEQRNLVLEGLVENMLDTKRYVANSEVSDEPGPLDKCCDAHLERYKLRKNHHHAMKARKQAIEATIKIFTIENATERSRDSTP